MSACLPQCIQVCDITEALTDQVFFITLSILANISFVFIFSIFNQFHNDRIFPSIFDEQGRKLVLINTT